eukprot:1521433-Amphidinium_carterae.1
MGELEPFCVVTHKSTAEQATVTQLTQHPSVAKTDMHNVGGVQRVVNSTSNTLCCKSNSSTLSGRARPHISLGPSFRGNFFQVNFDCPSEHGIYK